MSLDPSDGRLPGDGVRLMIHGPLRVKRSDLQAFLSPMVDRVMVVNDDDNTFRLFAEAYGRAWAGRTDVEAERPKTEAASSEKVRRAKRRVAGRGMKLVVKPAL